VVSTCRTTSLYTHGAPISIAKEQSPVSNVLEIPPFLETRRQPASRCESVGTSARFEKRTSLRQLDETRSASRNVCTCYMRRNSRFPQLFRDARLNSLDLANTETSVSSFVLRPVKHGRRRGCSCYGERGRHVWGTRGLIRHYRLGGIREEVSTSGTNASYIA
jgi:hypothetical protein